MCGVLATHQHPEPSSKARNRSSSEGINKRSDKPLLYRTGFLHLAEVILNDRQNIKKPEVWEAIQGGVSTFGGSASGGPRIRKGDRSGP